MKIRILCVGALKEEAYKIKIAADAARIRKKYEFEIIEVKDEKNAEHMSDAEIMKVKQKEGERLLPYLKKTPGEFVVALCIEGKMHTSESWKQKLKEWREQRQLQQITYIIGGSLGLDPAVIKRADYSLSISRLTFPHNLMRVLLTEQIAGLVENE